MSTYLTTITIGFFAFLFVAFLITIPYMIYHYRRFGGIPLLKVAIFFGFVLYMICAFLLTVLPLPSRESVAAMTNPYIQYIPFSTYAAAFSKAGLDFSRPATLLQWDHWKIFFSSFSLFEILCNIIMQIPLGVFLRYYFRCGFRKTLLIGFLLSLCYELIQLSGLFFIYPRPYRLASVDDLIDNTLGAVIGYQIAPVLCSILPGRDELDHMAILKGKRITLTRRVTAAVIDWIPFFCLILAIMIFKSNFRALDYLYMFFFYILWIALVFVICQRLFHGQTLGKKLLRLKVADRETFVTPKLSQLITRYSMLYLLLPLAIILLGIPLIVMVFAIMSDSDRQRAFGIAGSCLLLSLIIYSIRRIALTYKIFPHSYFSKTQIIFDPSFQNFLHKTVEKS